HHDRGAVAQDEVALSWVELEVRPGPGGLHASFKVAGRPPSRVEQAEIADVLAALDETEGSLQRS
nr:hypothetical protein [Actinomycetota bacterium]